MHPALIKAKAEAADRARAEAVRLALEEINAARAKTATEHMVEALEDAFAGLLVRPTAARPTRVGRIYVDRVDWREVRLRAHCPTEGGPKKETVAGDITLTATTEGSIVYSYNKTRFFTLDDMIEALAQALTGIAVPDENPPRRVALTLAECERLAELVATAGEDQDLPLVDRLLPPQAEAPPAVHGRPGRNVELEG